MKAKQQKIYDSVISRVDRDGWTSVAFNEGIRHAGITTAQARAFFPQGISDVIAAFHQRIDDYMQASIKAKRQFLTMRVRDKITFAVRARLEAIDPYQEPMRRLLLWSAMPGHVGLATKQLWAIADQIWIKAGDTSRDYNYYTKRLLLIAVMKATLAFWLQDRSAGHSETWAFLDRRIDNIMTLGKGLSVAKTIGISDILSIMRSRFAA